MYMNGIWNLWQPAAKYQIHIRVLVHLCSSIQENSWKEAGNCICVFVYLCICVFVLFNCLRGWRYGGERLLIVTDCRVPLNPGMATKTGIKISRRQNTVKRYPVIQNWNKYNELKWYPVIQNWKKDIKML